VLFHGGSGWRLHNACNPATSCAFTVRAQLIDSRTGGHVWASRFDRDLTDIFAVQDELTQEIVGALKLKLSAGDGFENLNSRLSGFSA
jgi:adenylate cyclase